MASLNQFHATVNKSGGSIVLDIQKVDSLKGKFYLMATSQVMVDYKSNGNSKYVTFAIRDDWHLDNDGIISEMAVFAKNFVEAEKYFNKVIKQCPIHGNYIFRNRNSSL